MNDASPVMYPVVWVLLVALLAVQLFGLRQEKTGFATMPIVTPVSLQYEQSMRQGVEPVSIAKLMEIIPELQQGRYPHVAPSLVEKLQRDRAKMLDLRNERHALNVYLMEAGVEILQELDKEQWEFVQSQRDSLQKQVEMDILDSVIQELQK
jgi:hypothetical protein